MVDVILQAAGLIAAGVLWRMMTPLGLDADGLRANLTGLVYVLLLPALVLVVLWRAPLSLDAVRVGVVATVGIVAGFLAAWVWLRARRFSPSAIGAALLAAAFPNATYLGLPVLEASLGPWARTIAVQYDLFACTPLLLSAGVIVAARYGGVIIKGHPALALLRVPPLWAAVAGVSLNLAGVPLPRGFGHWLDMLSAGVVPLMLFALGLGLRWSGGWGERVPALLPVVGIQLVLMPLVVWGAGVVLGLRGETLTAVALEGAMPSMVLGVVICDRYRLDTTLYAAAVTLSTALSMITLPFWFELLQG